MRHIQLTDGCFKVKFLMWSSERNSFSLCQSKIEYLNILAKLGLNTSAYNKTIYFFKNEPISRQIVFVFYVIIKGHFCHAHLVKS